MMCKRVDIVPQISEDRAQAVTKLVARLEGLAKRLKLNFFLLGAREISLDATSTLDAAINRLDEENSTHKRLRPTTKNHDN